MLGFCAFGCRGQACASHSLVPGPRVCPSLETAACKMAELPSASHHLVLQERGCKVLLKIPEIKASCSAVA